MGQTLVSTDSCNYFFLTLQRNPSHIHCEVHHMVGCNDCVEFCDEDFDRSGGFEGTSYLKNEVEMSLVRKGQVANQEIEL